jgi:two-component system response regulator AtoC
MALPLNRDEVRFASRDFPARILVVEDALTTREMLSHFLVSRGYRVRVVSSDEAVRCLRTDRPDAVILNLVGSSGVEVMETFRSLDESIPLLVVADAEPFPAGDRVGPPDATLIVRPFEERELEQALTQSLGPRTRPDIVPARRTVATVPPITSLLGQSRSMQEVRQLIARVADTDVTILLHGESGTGKEVTARALRHASLRRDKPFVKVNCAALPNDLLESELFGYEKGAFTGALQSKPGKFELADHGTIFLDEIGEMTHILQAKLLQVLQDGEFSRLGSAADVRVDVRIIAATNRDLKRAVAEGQFREDLYFRLNVLNIRMPPLREHKEDIPQLTEHFIRQQAERLRNRAAVRMSEDTKELFLEYDWPGNVRELENLVKRMMVLGTDAPIRTELRESCSEARRPPAVEAARTAAPPGEPEHEDEATPPTSLKEIGRLAAREAERVAILDMLERTRWNRKEAAEILGISYKALLYKIKENHLDDPH